MSLNSDEVEKILRNILLRQFGWPCNMTIDFDWGSATSTELKITVSQYSPNPMDDMSWLEENTRKALDS